jgi:hypothetical protein
VQNENSSSPNQSGQNKKRIMIVTVVVVIMLVVTWAVATVFEIALVKSFAIVILSLFVAAIAFFMLGFG